MAALLALAVAGLFAPTVAGYRDQGYPGVWNGDAETAFEAHICSWSYVDACSREMQEWMVQSLQIDGRKLFPAAKQNALAMLAPQEGEHILDLGCGIGSGAPRILLRGLRRSPALRPPRSCSRAAQATTPGPLQRQSDPAA